MKIGISSRALSLLAGVSVMAMVAATAAQAKVQLATVQGYMDHGKLVVTRIATHAVTPRNLPPKVTKIKLTYDFSASVNLKVPTEVAGWGLYDTSTCEGITAGKMKATSKKGKNGKFSTNVTNDSGATTSYCPDGINDFSTSNLVYTWTNKKAAVGATDSGSGIWNSGDVSNYEYIITNDIAITYAGRK